MTLHSRLSGDYLRVQQLLISCPFHEAMLACPCVISRQLPMSVRMDTMEDSPEVEIFRLVQHHQYCLHSREKPVKNKFARVLKQTLIL